MVYIKRKTEDELFDLMCTVEEEIGESCIEYVGYGYMKDFENFIYDFFGRDIKKKNLNITKIWAFLDVINEFYNEIYVAEDNYQAELKLVASFLVSDYCSDECYNIFIEKMNDYLHYK